MIRGQLASSLLCAATIAPMAPAAEAFEPMGGCFVAEQSCAATRSIRRAGKSGDVRLQSGQTYELLGANKLGATYFQVRVPGASPDARWVEVGCGRTVEECGPVTVEPPPSTMAAASHAENVLAVSWQPAFCEGHRTKPECAAQTGDRFDAVHLSLHGLWPQPRDRAYCGVATTEKAIDRRGRWDLLPPVELEDAIRAALDRVMPGTRPMLERHEWVKHGTCYAATAEEYFAESVRLVEELNASPVRSLLADRLGALVQLDELRAAFDTAFGPGTGERVEMGCARVGGRQLVSELKINLAGEITPGTALADLLADAPEAAESCVQGIVDPAGFDGS